MRNVWSRHRRGQFHGQATGVLTADGHFLNASPSLAAFLRIDSARLPGSSLWQWMDRDAAFQIAPRIEEAAHGGSDHFQVRILTRDHPIWVSLRLAPGGEGPDGPTVVASFEAPRAA